MSQDQYRVVYVEPGKPAREMMLGTDLKDLQQVVGGLIELIYAHGDRTVIVGNDEAKLICSYARKRHREQAAADQKGSERWLPL